MADMYIRKFSPGKLHIIAAVFLLAALILFVSGGYRAFRVMGRLDQTGLSFEGEGYIKKNDSILFSAKPVEGELKGAVEAHAISCGTIINGFFSPDCELFVVKVAGKYRFVAVEQNSAEYERLLAGEELTGYFSYKYDQFLFDYVSSMDEYYEDYSVIPVEECSHLGIIVVNRKRELWSFLWGIPFLCIGLFLLKKAGSLFFYTPETPFGEEY